MGDRHGQVLRKVLALWSHSLLALNDGSIRATRDYWLELDTLPYLTRDGKSASVPLSELDLSFTLQLNRERGRDSVSQKQRRIR